MKKYVLPLARAFEYSHPAPERTAGRSAEWDIVYQVWPNRESMARSIRMQQRGENRNGWKAVVPLSDGEGY